jgi:AAA domain, putative AbiEii toxin, Type IV TA system
VELILDKLGRIEHAEIDVRPLTVFVGENNTNKTWAAYCLYGLARHLTWGHSLPVNGKFGHGFLPVVPDEFAKRVEGVIRSTLENLPQGAGIAQFQVRRQDIIGSPSERVSFLFEADRIRDLLRLQEEQAVGSRAALVLAPHELTSRESAATIEINRSQRSVTVSLAAATSTLEYVWRGNRGDAESTVDAHVSDVLRTLAFRVLAPGKIVALPSERKALVATYKMLRPEFELVLSRPVLEFVELLKTIENIASAQDEIKLLDSVGHLEASILGGNIRFHGMAAGVGLAYFLEAGGALPMHAASSLVRALAGLDVYLRYWAQPGDLLVIDEPEMNAHPDAQLRITELIATLVNQGVRVVLTTHSPYVLDHLGTLVEASQLEGDPRARTVQRLRLKSSEALLKPEQLAVYRFGLDGQVTPIFDRETRSMDTSTFSDVGDAETNLFGEVLAGERGRGD